MVWSQIFVLYFPIAVVLSIVFITDISIRLLGSSYQGLFRLTEVIYSPSLGLFKTVQEPLPSDPTSRTPSTRMTRGGVFEGRVSRSSEPYDYSYVDRITILYLPPKHPRSSVSHDRCTVRPPKHRPFETDRSCRHSSPTNI